MKRGAMVGLVCGMLLGGVVPAGAQVPQQAPRAPGEPLGWFAGCPVYTFEGQVAGWVFMLLAVIGAGTLAWWLWRAVEGWLLPGEPKEPHAPDR